MKSKQPIDVLRDSASSMNVGTPEDGSIEGFVTLEDRLLIIKKKSVYEHIFADTIDPGRTNAAIPDTQQRVLDIGSESPLLCRTLLTADTLFKTSHLEHVIDCKAAMSAAFRFTLGLVAISLDRDRLNREIDEALSGVDGAVLTTGFNIPVIANLEARSKAILYRGHDVIRALMDIVRLFYGSKITHADSLLKYAKTAFEPEYPFRKFIEDMAPTLRSVWNMRNAAVHPNPTARILMKNFSLRADGSLEVPSIEVIDQDMPQPMVPAITLFDSIIESLQIIFEELVALLCGRHAKFGKFQISVMELPQDRRRQEHVRFSYVVNLDGQWQPLG